MKLFGHEFGHHEVPQPAASPAEVAAAEAAANIAEAPVAEASADFQVPTIESATPVTDEAVKEAMGAAASLLDTTEAQANGTMDVAPTTPTSTDTDMKPMAASQARIEGQIGRSLDDAMDTHSEIVEANASGELDKVPEVPTDGDNEIIDALRLPEVGNKTEEDLISSDTSIPSVGAEVDTLNNLETESVLSAGELESLPGPVAATDETIVNELNLPEAGSAESVAILNEADTTAPAAEADVPVTNEQTPEQQ